MLRAHIKELILIFLAVSCQIFACMNISFLNKYIEVVSVSDSFFIKSHLDLNYWMLVTTFGRVFGAYFVGKYTDKVGLLKSILFISVGFTIVAILCAVFCITQESSYGMDQGFYLFRFCYCFLEPAAFILPFLYVLDHSSHLNYYKTSVLFLGAIFIAKSASYHLIHLPSGLIKFWYIFALISTLLAWGIYHYLVKHSGLKKMSISQNKLMPLRVKILIALLGAACATGVFYHHFFESHYSLNIKIIDDSADLGIVPYYALYALFFLPAAQICKKFGLYRTTQFSLCMLFILGINSVFVNLTPTIYVIQQVLFSFFSTLFIVPILATLYQIYKSYSSTLDVMFLFALGFSACSILARFEQEIGLQKGFGWCTYNISILLCFIMIHRIHFDRNSEKGSKSTSTNKLKLFEV